MATSHTCGDCMGSVCLWLLCKLQQSCCLRCSPVCTVYGSRVHVNMQWLVMRVGEKQWKRQPQRTQHDCD